MKRELVLWYIWTTGNEVIPATWRAKISGFCRWIQDRTGFKGCQHFLFCKRLFFLVQNIIWKDLLNVFKTYLCTPLCKCEFGRRVNKRETKQRSINNSFNKWQKKINLLLKLTVCWTTISAAMTPCFQIRKRQLIKLYWLCWWLCCRLIVCFNSDFVMGLRARGRKKGDRLLFISDSP